MGGVKLGLAFNLRGKTTSTLKGKLLKYLVLAFLATPGLLSQQLIVVKNRFLAAPPKIEFPKQPKTYFILLRVVQNNIGCFSHVTKLANLRFRNTSFQRNTKLLIFYRGSHFVVPIGVRAPQGARAYP